MVNKLADFVTANQIGVWLLIAFLVCYFVYKEWPEFKKRVSHGAVKEQRDEQTDRTVDQRLNAIESDVKEIKDKLNRDYYRINRVEQQIDKTKSTQADEMEELEIIMRALLGVLRGLQEQGTNVPTKEAEAEIQAYLNKKAHRPEYSD